MPNWAARSTILNPSHDMDSSPIFHLSLCAGYGGLDLGLKRACPALRTIAYAEIEAFACELLLARMEAGQLDQAPIWTDVRTFPWDGFCDQVDILSAGYPCQPFSQAGLQLGSTDPRHLWPAIIQGIQIARPGLVFLENVHGHLALGLDAVLRDLQHAGYRSTFGLHSAAEIGACHERKRLFILANSVCERGQLSFERVVSAIKDVGSKGTARRTEDGWFCTGCGKDVFGGCECDHGKSQCPSCGEWTYPFVYEPDDGCSQCGASFPVWSDHTTWPVESCVRGNDDGPANRVDRLRLLGNGVVPATAELAFRYLCGNLLQPNMT